MVKTIKKIFCVFAAASLLVSSYLLLGITEVSSVHADVGFVNNIPPVNYVALGDSRAADPQNGGIGASCDRSSFSYPNMIASIIPVKTFANVSCVGATIYNFYVSQYFPFHTAPPQFNALNSATNVVTISIGGNDISWFHLIASCFTQEMHQDAHCRDDLGKEIVIAQRLKKLRTNFDLALKAVRDRAHDAKVFVVGHGGYYGDAPCERNAQISAADLPVVHDFFTQFNKTMSDVTAENHDYFVDIESYTHGHDACAAPAQRWFTGNIEIDSTPRRHPTELGSNKIGEITAQNIIRALAPKSTPTDSPLRHSRSNSEYPDNSGY